MKWNVSVVFVCVRKQLLMAWRKLRMTSVAWRQRSVWRQWLYVRPPCSSWLFLPCSW